MIKQETHRLASRHRDGSPMYPGEWLFTWLRVPWGWLLIAMQPAAKQR